MASRFNQRIAMYSPLPPVPSGISDYTFELAQAMIDRGVELDLFLDDGYTPETYVIDGLRARIHHYGAYRRKAAIKPYDANIIQFGNNPAHWYMYHEMQRLSTPTITVIHDVPWSPTFINVHAKRGTLDDAREIIAGLYPPGFDDDTLETFDAALDAYLTGDNALLNRWIKQNPLLDNVLINSDALIVHNDSAGADIVAAYGDAYRLPPVHIVEAATRPNLHTKEAARALHRPLERFKFVVGAVGHISRNKRYKVLIEAFKVLLKYAPDSLLLLVGPHNDEQYRQELLALTDDIKGNVSYTGMRTISEGFETLVAACDVGVQLRTDDMGATSAAISRFMSAGRPCIISDVPAWRGYPDNVCYKVPHSTGKVVPLPDGWLHPDPEINAIASQLLVWYRYPDQLGEAASEVKMWYNNGHDLDNMVTQYMHVIKEVIERDNELKELVSYG
jgi:glycosyltransferase involved in cell wall biosynthesis